MWCCIAGKPVANIQKALWSSKMSGTYYLMMYYSVPEGLNLQKHCYENLKFCNSTQYCRCSPPPPPHDSHHSCNSLLCLPWLQFAMTPSVPAGKCWYNTTGSQCRRCQSSTITHFNAIFWPSMPGSDISGCDHVACVLVSPLSCHCTDHSQLSHALSFTVLSCSVTPLHMYCFPLLCCSWPKFLHLQLTAFKSDNDDPPTPTISMEWASLATVQCTVHFQEVSVFYYK